MDEQKTNTVNGQYYVNQQFLSKYSIPDDKQICLKHVGKRYECKEWIIHEIWCIDGN